MSTSTDPIRGTQTFLERVGESPQCCDPSSSMYTINTSSENIHEPYSGSQWRLQCFRFDPMHANWKRICTCRMELALYKLIIIKLIINIHHFYLVRNWIHYVWKWSYKTKPLRELSLLFCLSSTTGFYVDKPHPASALELWARALKEYLTLRSAH